MSTQVTKKGRAAAGREPRADKVSKVEALRERFSNASGLVLFDYRGLKVGQMTDLRRRTRQAGISLSVVKNNLLERAVEGTEFEVIRGCLGGPVSIATTEGDAVAPAKVLSDFLKEAAAGQIAGGVLEGRYLEPAQVQQVAELPSREVLLARVAATLQAPVVGLPRVLNALLTKLIFALQAVAKKKESGV